MKLLSFILAIIGFATQVMATEAYPSASPSATIAPIISMESPAMESGSPAENTQNSAESRHSYTSVHVFEPYIAMTFDDGPHPTLTPKLLDMLKQRGIKATFFLIGQNAKQYPDIVKRIHDEGHEIANHSWSHPALNRCSPEKFRRELEDTNAAIKEASGITPTLIRPPYGATNANLNRIMNEKYGMKVILWSIDPLDWKYRNSERVSSYILKNVKPGNIILSHDIHPTTVAAMPTVFDTLLARGYQFVTVSELIAKQTAAPPKGTPFPPAGNTSPPHAISSPAESPSAIPEASPGQSPSPSTSPNFSTRL